MISQKTLDYFHLLKPPKGTTIQVAQDIEITTSNTNPFEVGFYVVLIFFDVYITIASQFWYGFGFGMLFAALMRLCFISKTTISLTPKEIVIKEGFLLKPYSISLDQIAKLEFVDKITYYRKEQTGTLIKLKKRFRN